jgi:hypothetical protein
MCAAMSGRVNKTIIFISIFFPLIAAGSAESTAQADSKPTGFSVGLGVGHETPLSIGRGAFMAESPLLNSFSVRLRWSNGLTLEPTVATLDDNDTVNLHTMLRYPVLQRGRMDLDVLTDGGYWRTSGELHSSQLTFGAGLGMNYWITPNFAASINATTNVYSRFKGYAANVDGSVIPYQSHQVVLGFDPRPTAMLHLFF